jgi:hypothetical protein
MRRSVVVVLVLLGISVVSASGTQQMVIWDFGSNAANYTTGPNAVNANVIGTPTLVLSGGTLDPDGKDGTAYVDVLGVSHIAGQSAAWDEIKVSGNNAKWITSIDTAGWADVIVRFDYKAWNSKTTTIDMDYRLSDTAAWTNILNNQTITADGNFNIFTYSLANIDAIENQPFVQFRFNDLDNKGSGKFAFDNFELTGTQIPEPATIALFGFGAAAIAGKQRKYS